MATMAKRAESSATAGVTPSSPLCSSTTSLDLRVANPAAVGQLLLKPAPSPTSPPSVSLP